MSIVNPEAKAGILRKFWGGMKQKNVGFWDGPWNDQWEEAFVITQKTMEYCSGKVLSAEGLNRRFERLEDPNMGIAEKIGRGLLVGGEAVSRVTLVLGASASAITLDMLTMGPNTLVVTTAEALQTVAKRLRSAHSLK